MKRVLGAVLVGALIFAADTASAQLKNSGTSRIRLVRAHCTTGPCDPFFTFNAGSVLFRRSKQPKLVINRKLGKMRINNLTRLGAPPIPPSLDGRVIGTIFYGQDENAVCPLANTVVTGEFATATLNCIVTVVGNAGCSGPVAFSDFTPPECSDVSQTIQDITVEVYEPGSVGVPEKLIATQGINVLGKSPDCASGGAGCP
jgi:hypothetical protein